MPHKELNFKPQLAKDYNPSKLKFPLWIQPKFEAVSTILNSTIKESTSD